MYFYRDILVTYLQGGPKSKLPNYPEDLLNRINWITFICQIELQSNITIFSVGIKISGRGLLCDVSNYA